MTDERFEIERIVEKRYRNDRLEYLIKWRGYPDSQNTWEPCKLISTSYTEKKSFVYFIANNIEGEQEIELLAEYEAHNKHKILNAGSRSTINKLSPNKQRNVI
jgi:hypothetical protein